MVLPSGRQNRFSTHVPHAIRTGVASGALIRASRFGVAAMLGATCLCTPLDQAHAVTAAEKQAEADAVFAQIDSLQTSLNDAMADYDRAQEAYGEACRLRDEAADNIEAETEHIEALQADLSKFVVGMYKSGGSTRFLDVMMDSSSFDEFLTSWDACNTIYGEGKGLIEQAQATRAKLEQARADYDEQSKRSEDEVARAEQKRAEIEQTQDALREQAQKLSDEAAELQAEEEAAAEAARQAEKARKQREAELAAAYEAAQKAQEEAAAQAAQQEQNDQASGNAAASAQPGEAVVMGAGFFANPCPNATSSSGFGYRTFDNSFHKGLDMAASEGTPYYAAEAGTVMYATNDGGYNGGAGNWVVISHGNGIVTKYMHSSATYVKPGDFVQRGQNIGAVGNTGQSFGAHLHFQVEVNGVAVNPLNYL